jgi:3-hydroxybutyryl-CoA dehydrogenase
MMKSIKDIAIVGAGIMGSGIAQVSAMSGYSVTMIDIDGNRLKKSRATIQDGLVRLTRKGKLSPESITPIMAKITTSESLNEAVRDADLIVEAAFENLEIKQNIFKDLEKYSKPSAIFGSNTSAIPITEIASATHSGERIIGIHFMNPVPLMKGVELIRGQLTSDQTAQVMLNYIIAIGKEPIVAIDYAGFIVSRLLDVLMNETIKMVQEGNMPEDIDRAMELCAGHPMGPCKLLDLVGAEIAMYGMETMERDFGNGYKPHPLLRKRVLAGLLGKKTGQGFYKYD